MPSKQKKITGKASSKQAPKVTKIQSENSISTIKNTSEVALIRSLAEISKQTDLHEIEYEKDGVYIRINRGGNVAYHAPVSHPTHFSNPVSTQHTQTDSQLVMPVEKEIDLSSHKGVVTSPMVGILYTRPKPEEADFVRIGQQVNAGDTVMLIESMKVFNPIKVQNSGTVVKILVENGTPVEFGAPLIIVE